MKNNNFKQRFLKYISFDTQSDENSTTSPSTLKQKELGKFLVEELKALNIDNAYMDEFGYVYGYIKSNCGSKNTIGLIAHMDTSDEASGKDVKPQIIPSYDGKIIYVNKGLNVILDPKEFPHMLDQIGHELITTDGTTLLGADDKAGIAIIMTYIEEMLETNAKYPNIIVTFTPDEEVGRGTEHFNYEYYKEHNCSIGYTLDGANPNVINCENFNAAAALVEITGKSVHPGSAKDIMINSMLVASEFNGMLDPLMVPEHTEGYEGFNHLTSIEGTVSFSRMTYIIRNHDLGLFAAQKKSFVDITEAINKKYGRELVKLTIKDTYFNMKEEVSKNYKVVENAIEAIKELDMTPYIVPIRGGTDGASLTFGGITCPNLGTGGQNFHGPFEYLSVDEASVMVELIKKLMVKYL